MCILFDHGTPAGIAQSLAGHEITEAIERGWDKISNGDLLTKAEDAGFELLLTTDKRIRYQQKFEGTKDRDSRAGNLSVACGAGASRPNSCSCRRGDAGQLC